MVSGSNSSVLYSSDPPGRVGSVETKRLRSHLAVSVSSSISPTRSPGSPGRLGGAPWNESMAWKIGVLLGSRVGRIASTIFSRGTSWPENASRTRDRTRAKSWRKDGSPDRSTRTASVFRNSPIRGSSSARSLRAAGTPITMSS